MPGINNSHTNKINHEFIVNIIHTLLSKLTLKDAGSSKFIRRSNVKHDSCVTHWNVNVSHICIYI